LYPFHFSNDKKLASQFINSIGDWNEQTSTMSGPILCEDNLPKT
jgi:hypothetical protein